eukprot:TRINITY_DN14645_c0_g1_i1.p2 TRINITY_DN14645_c0_g1~~TRINITY_DN14645_c0_g1_i1.p2  ORF type:complete len:224 (+),score=25.15 TRINITY_DN14645_c0_g1_i1:63-674(+)
MKEDEIVEIAELQAECFHEPPKFKFMENISYVSFKAEVLDVMRRKYESVNDGDYMILIAREKQSSQAIGVIELDIRNDRELLLQLNSLDSLFGSTKFAYVCSMAVKPGMRRKGVARSLLSAVEQLAGQWGHEVLVLQVFEDNVSAIKLYTSSGYQLLDKEKGLISWLRGRQKLSMYKLQKLTKKQQLLQTKYNSEENYQKHMQ